MTHQPLNSPIATALRALARTSATRDVSALFAQDSLRSEHFRRSACGLELDYSRQRINAEALATLVSLGEEARLPTAMQQLQGGDCVNVTEGRPALHTALRDTAGGRPEVDAARATMRDWCEQLRGGEHRGFAGEPITDVVNIGIGGSDLGPRMVATALAGADAPLRVHFVSNIDPDDLSQCLAPLKPARTLFIVCSKSFRTEETRVNAEAARRWLHAAGASTDTLDRHFLAVSSNLEAAAAFGIPAAHCLPMWDWVGGRYSLWSAVGLSAALAIGWPAFEELLTGAAEMDAHALAAPAADNLPLLSALIDCWNSHFLGAGTLAVLPYSHRLRLLPDYLQQLVMESNGKAVDTDGTTLTYHSSPVLWGAAGTNGQHSFHQLLHQGTRNIAIELILPLANSDDPQQHARLVAHCLAQSSVFTHGRSADEALADLISRGETPARAAELTPHLTMAGNRQHNLLSMDRLTPRTLGALLSLWEHRTYFNAVLLGINAFDQWGVEMGKVVSGQIQAAMADNTATLEALDAGTRRMLTRWREANSG